jgi:RNA polymerase sigma factor (sigma-70 family)
VSVSLSHVDGPGDAELIAAVRGGDLDSYGELYARHVDAARRLARQLTTPSDADDLVSDAFTKVLTVLQRGGGPDLAFRAYLLTAVRRLHVDRIRSGSRLRSVDDLTPFDPGLPFHDTAVEGFDNAAAAKAFASLPERWQMVLWHTEVEGQKPADIAPLLGMSANSVAALAYRAREGLRQAFLSQHAADMDDVDCAWTRDHLGAYVRGGLSRRDAGRVDDHLADCRACAAVYLELTEVNSGLAGLLAPLLLGAAGLGYLGSAHGGAAAAGGVVGGGLAGARAWVATHASLTAVGGVAATATALLAVYGATHLGGNHAVDAGTPPTLAQPGSSTATDPQSPSGRPTSHRAHAGQTPSVALRNAGPTALPTAGPTSSTTTAAAPSSQPVEPQSSATTDQPSDPATTPSDPTSTPIDPVQDVSFTSQPPAHPALGSTYVVEASGGTGSITFSVDPSTTNAGTPQAACSLTGNTVTFDHAGTCVIAADVTGKRAVTHAVQRIDVPKADQTVTITSTAPADAAVDGTYDVQATSTSGRAVTLTTNDACSVSGTTVTFQHAAGCVVTATQEGDADLAAASDAQTVQVAKASQAITLEPAAPSTAEVGDTYAYTATGGASGQQVVVTTGNPDVCAVSGTTVAFINPGTCIISADQAGTADYEAAPTVTASVKVVPPTESDLGVTAAKGPQDQGHAMVTATVTGVPQGRTATLTATATGSADFRPDPATTSCRQQGNTTWTCTVTADPASFTFRVNDQRGRTVTFTIAPDAPLTDPNPDNNTVGIHWE